MDRGVDRGRSDALRVRLIRHADTERATRHAQQRRRRSALSAELGRGAGEAVRIGLEVRVGVHLHAELG